MTGKTSYTCNEVRSKALSFPVFNLVLIPIDTLTNLGRPRAWGKASLVIDYLGTLM